MCDRNNLWEGRFGLTVSEIRHHGEGGMAEFVVVGPHDRHTSYHGHPEAENTGTRARL